jgi:hypothetical protein
VEVDSMVQLFVLDAFFSKMYSRRKKNMSVVGPNSG